MHPHAHIYTHTCTHTRAYECTREAAQVGTSPDAQYLPTSRIAHPEIPDKYTLQDWIIIPGKLECLCKVLLLHTFGCIIAQGYRHIVMKTFCITGPASWLPHFLAPIKKNGNIFKPRYVCTSDSLIHVNIVVVSAVLPLDTILTDTKNGFLDTFPRCKVAVLSETRSTTIGLLLHARHTESTSNTDLHA